MNPKVKSHWRFADTAPSLGYGESDDEEGGPTTRRYSGKGCARCGARLDPNSKFCTRCGARQMGISDNGAPRQQKGKAQEALRVLAELMDRELPFTVAFISLMIAFVEIRCRVSLGLRKLCGDGKRGEDAISQREFGRHFQRNHQRRKCVICEWPIPGPGIYCVRCGARNSRVRIATD